MIGQIKEEAQARSFHDYLYVQGIDNEVEADQDGSWSVWVHAEEELGRAKEMLAAFQENPVDPKFQSQGATAEKMREEKRKDQARYEQRLKERRHLFRPMTAYGFGPITFVFIFICVVVFLKSKFGNDFEPVLGLFISKGDVPGASRFDHLWASFLRRVLDFKEALPEVRRGEIWRLFTPMFIHMNFLHIFFNMLWLRDLGSMVEGCQGSGLFIILTLVIAALSNTAQFLAGGPQFGGMSGVVYGLVGYIWIRGKLDPGSGLYLHKSTVLTSVIWFFGCLIGFVGPVANTAHGVGFLVGITWGFLSSLRHR